MIDLNKEAEEYAEKHYFKVEAPDCIRDYIAGANSKYVQAEKIKAQIEELIWLNLRITFGNPIKKVMDDRIQELKQQLKQLEDGK